MSKFSLKMLKGLVDYATKNSANSTSSGVLYQPKAPAALKKFSKVDNDK